MSAIGTCAGLAVGVALVTLWPLPNTDQPPERLCISCGSLGGLDLLQNVLLFGPLGFALVAAGLRVPQAWALGGLYSLMIEALQWRLVAGRDASLGDLLANTLGAALGAFLASRRQDILTPTRDQARALSYGWWLLSCLAAAIGAWALRPAPVQYVYWSQWTPVRRFTPRFTGRLDSLVLGNLSIEAGATLDPSVLDAQFRAGLFDVAAVFTPGDSRIAGAQLIARAANPLGVAFDVAQEGRDIVFSSRRNAARIGFRTPRIRLLDALPSGGTAPRVRLQSQVAVRETRLEASFADGRKLGVTTRMSLGRTWGVLSPFGADRGVLALVGAGAIVFTLILPLSFWLIQGFAPPRALAIAFGSLILQLGVLPVAFGISPGGWAEVVGGFAGLWAGVTAGSWARRLEGRLSERGMSHRLRE